MKAEIYFRHNGETYGFVLDSNKIAFDNCKKWYAVFTEDDDKLTHDMNYRKKGYIFQVSGDNRKYGDINIAELTCAEVIVMPNKGVGATIINRFQLDIYMVEPYPTFTYLRYVDGDLKTNSVSNTYYSVYEAQLDLMRHHVKDELDKIYPIDDEGEVAVSFKPDSITFKYSNVTKEWVILPMAEAKARIEEAKKNRKK